VIEDRGDPGFDCQVEKFSMVPVSPFGKIFLPINLPPKSIFSLTREEHLHPLLLSFIKIFSHKRNYSTISASIKVVLYTLFPVMVEFQGLSVLVE
jgi:hypothetical protein